jgi:UDP-N-acetylmuramyl pentapeptide phosphotransferase/UDP-N-acetylglucosamine-1-phosphate transferase
MGDMGSMFLGFTLGCIAIRLQVINFMQWQVVLDYAPYIFNSSFYGWIAGLTTAIIPVLVLGIPVFDTLLVTVLRTLNGLSISTAGKDHSSHRLMQIKGKIQRFIDKCILLVIRATGRRKQSQHSVLKGIAHTRSVLILYACGAFLGIAALAVPHLTLKSVVLLLIMVLIIAFFSANKLAEVLVYTKKNKGK